MLLLAAVVPHPPLALPSVGQGRETGIAGTLSAYKKIAADIAAAQLELIIFFTPHGAVYEDYIHISPGRAAQGGFGRFGAPDTRFSTVYDEEFVHHLSRLAEAENIPAGTLGGRGHEELDHGVMVPMHFIREAGAEYKSVRVSLSGFSLETHYRFGQCVQKAINETNRRAVIVASGDLSHKLTPNGPYGFAPEGPAFDRELVEALKQGDFLTLLSFEPDFCEKAAECGLKSFVMMAGALDGRDAAVSFGHYEGPYGVGYAAAGFVPGGENPARRFLIPYRNAKRAKMEARRSGESAYVRLARETVESFVKTGRIVSPRPEPTQAAAYPEGTFTQRAGTFVSIKKDGKLRGCIGTTEPYRPNIAEEIIGNAVSAGTQDPRFNAITEDELDDLAYSVDILSPAEDIESPDELDVLRYGVIVYNGMKRGLLLPNLDGVDTAEQQIDIARQKAGIPAGAEYKLKRFEVVRYV